MDEVTDKQLLAAYRLGFNDEHIGTSRILLDNSPNLEYAYLLGANDVINEEPDFYGYTETDESILKRIKREQ